MTTELVSPQPEFLDVVARSEPSWRNWSSVSEPKPAPWSRKKLADISRVAAWGKWRAVSPMTQSALGRRGDYAAGMGQMLQRDSSDRGEMIKALEQIRNEESRASDVIQSLREFLRREEPRDERVNMNELMDKALLLTEAKARTAEVVVVKTYDDDLPDIFGHRTQLEQVAIDLIVNGIEAMLNASEPARELHLSTKRTDSRHIQFSLANMGGGGILGPGPAENIRCLLHHQGFGDGDGIVHQPVHH